MNYYFHTVSYRIVFIEYVIYFYSSNKGNFGSSDVMKNVILFRFLIGRVGGSGRIPLKQTCRRSIEKLPLIKF